MRLQTLAATAIALTTASIASADWTITSVLRETRTALAQSGPFPWTAPDGYDSDTSTSGPWTHNTSSSHSPSAVSATQSSDITPSRISFYGTVNGTSITTGSSQSAIAARAMSRITVNFHLDAPTDVRLVGSSTIPFYYGFTSWDTPRVFLSWGSGAVNYQPGSTNDGHFAWNLTLAPGDYVMNANMAFGHVVSNTQPLSGSTNGFIEFGLEIIPAPASLALLPLAGLAAARRRRRQ